MFTAQQGKAADFLHADPEGAMYEVTTVETEGRFGDLHLPAVYCSQLKTRAQCKLSTAIKKITHCIFPELHKGHIHRGLGQASVNVIGDQGEQRAIHNFQDWCCHLVKNKLILGLLATITLEVVPF
jgi:hypothetical protein